MYCFFFQRKNTINDIILKKMNNYFLYQDETKNSLILSTLGNLDLSWYTYDIMNIISNQIKFHDNLNILHSINIQIIIRIDSFYNKNIFLYFVVSDNNEIFEFLNKNIEKELIYLYKHYGRISNIISTIIDIVKFPITKINNKNSITYQMKNNSTVNFNSEILNNFYNYYKMQLRMFSNYYNHNIISCIFGIKYNNNNTYYNIKNSKINNIIEIIDDFILVNNINNKITFDVDFKFIDNLTNYQIYYNNIYKASNLFNFLNSFKHFYTFEFNKEFNISEIYNLIEKDIEKINDILTTNFVRNNNYFPDKFSIILEVIPLKINKKKFMKFLMVVMVLELLIISQNSYKKNY